jgi:hypothetical protein
MKRVCESPDFFEIAKQEAKFFKFLERYVLEVDGSHILPDTVSEQFIHHPVYIRHPRHIIPKLLQQIRIPIQIVYRIQSLIYLIHVYQGREEPLL